MVAMAGINAVVVSQLQCRHLTWCCCICFYPSHLIFRVVVIQNAITPEEEIFYEEIEKQKFHNQKEKIIYQAGHRAFALVSKTFDRLSYLNVGKNLIFPSLNP
jgi:hypothetical protein